MKIKYIDKGIARDFKRVDRVITKTVKKQAFSQGELTYFQVNEFEYISIPKSDILEVIQ